MKSRPPESEYAPFFAGYVSLVPEPDVLAVLEAQPAELARLSSGVPSDREKFRYAEGKWTIRELVGHIVDSERIFGYRAFCISRGEQAPLPAFEENDYIRNSHYDRQPLGDLVSEFLALRGTNLAFLRQLENNDWERLGTSNKNPASVRALAFIMAGHVRHHFAVLRDRYGVLPGL
jgi:hypothetical protein